jgi:nitrogenase molybdenum-iron protein NifN
MLTPGDIEALSDWIASFDLVPVIVPDLGDSLDGHLDNLTYSTLTTGGTPFGRFADLGNSAATLVIGPSLYKAADLLKTRTGVPDLRFDGLMSLEDCDAFTAALSRIAGAFVPRRIERQRAQLLDATVDCHLQFGGARVAIAADPDLLAMLVRFCADLGVETTTAVASMRSDRLAMLPAGKVIVGDLEELETGARASEADLLIASSHAAESARRLGLPLLRAGFPLHDQYGGFARRWVGYGGARQTLFDLANLISRQRLEIAPYHSVYRQEHHPHAGLSPTPVRAGLAH